MKTLIVGYGSIGKRHARVLRPLSSAIGLVSAQEVSDYPRFKTLGEALANFSPDYVVICTVTSQHAENLKALKEAGFSGKVMVEKPVFNHAAENAAPYPFKIYVGYHLRFHAVIHALQEALQGQKIVSASAYVGQHLSLWRPDRDPKETYSAHRAQGGGVMRDLSHELDMAQYLFGNILACEGKAERRGDVTVDSEDSATFRLKCAQCDEVTVHMNCLDLALRRDWTVETDKDTIHADLAARSITVDGKTRLLNFEGDDAYRAMHKAALGGGPGVCGLEEALIIVRHIDAVEMA